MAFTEDMPLRFSRLATSRVISTRLIMTLSRHAYLFLRRALALCYTQTFFVAGRHSFFLLQIITLMQGDEVFQQYLQDPGVRKAEKSASLGALLKDMKASETTSSLFGMLYKH